MGLAAILNEQDAEVWTRQTMLCERVHGVEFRVITTPSCCRSAATSWSVNPKNSSHPVQSVHWSIGYIAHRVEHFQQRIIALFHILAA
jgi:hypothetical protein